MIVGCNISLNFLKYQIQNSLGYQVLFSRVQSTKVVFWGNPKMEHGVIPSICHHLGNAEDMAIGHWGPLTHCQNC